MMAQSSELINYISQPFGCFGELILVATILIFLDL